MNKAELKASLEKLLEQLETEEETAINYFLGKFNAPVEDWKREQNLEYERTMKPLWDAGENLASAIHSLEE